jgi:hypothetical protein
VSLFELWIYDLDSYALIDRLFFGASAGVPISSVTGSPIRLVRWGNSGLALITDTDIYRGSGGVVSSQQLNVTIPASLLAKSGQLPITIFDTSSNLFSSNSLSLLITSVPATGSTTKVNSLDLAGPPAT